MSKVEQKYTHPLQSCTAADIQNFPDDQAHGMSKREVVFLEFMGKLISTPDQFDCTINNKVTKAKRYTNQYFKTLEEWDNE